MHLDTSSISVERYYHWKESSILNASPLPAASPDAFSYVCSHCRLTSLQCLHCSTAITLDHPNKKGIQNKFNYFRERHYFGQHYDNSDIVASIHNSIDECGDTLITNVSTKEGEDDSDASVTTNSDEDSLGLEFDIGRIDIDYDNECDDNYDNDGRDNVLQVDGATQTLKLMKEFTDLFGQNLKAAIYFCHQAQFFDNGSCRTGGLHGIVQQAIMQQRTYDTSDPTTSKRYFLLLKLLHRTTDKGTLMDYTSELMTMTASSNDNPILPHFPKTEEEAEKMIMGQKHSMKNNLPIEQFIAADDDIHASVSVGDTIDIMMGHGIRPSFAQDEHGNRDASGLNGCPYALYMVDRIRSTLPNPNNTAIGWLTLWSDGFLTSYIKQFENSAWLLTLTVSEPHGKRSEEHTHIIAMGPSKKVKHDSVVTRTLKEISGLRKPKKRYCGKTNTWIDTAFFLLLYKADRPERNELTHTSQLGKFTKRFLWSAFADREYLPSCRSCYANRVRILLGLIQQREKSGNEAYCQQCCDWDFSTQDSPGWKSSSSNLSKMFGTTTSSAGVPKYPTEATANHTPFPSERALPEQSHIRPIKQTFTDLKHAVVLAFQQVALGQWFRYNLESYLRSCGVNEKTRKKVYDAAKRAFDELKLIDDEGQTLARLKEMVDENYLISEGVIPAIWSIDDLRMDNFPELPMHLMFTGITKSLVGLMDVFMTASSHGSKFETLYNTIQNGLNAWQLCYLKSRPFPTARFVSENYLALARIIPWTYAVYFNNFDPTRNNNASYDTVLSLQKLINSYFVMVSHLMRTHNDVDIDLLDESIKLFLSCWDEAEKAVSASIPITKTSISMWSKGNHLSLLNLTNQVGMYGSPRLLWEGNDEAVIQQNKKLHSKIRLTRSYFQITMKKYLEEKCIKTIDKHLIEQKMISAPRPQQAEKLYQRYQKGEIEHIISNGLVLSCVILHIDDCSHCVFAVEGRRRDTLSLRKIQMNGRQTLKTIGLVYTGFSLTAEMKEVGRDQMAGLTMSPCVLLPLRLKDKPFDGMFTIITSDWKILHSSGTIGYPQLCVSLFNDC